MLLARSTVVFIAASITYHAVTSGCTSCFDGYNLTYTLPMFETCDVKMVNGSEVQLIPKLIPRRFGDKNCYGHGISPGYRICRIPDCLKEPCQNGWCQEQMENYTCHCPPDFNGIYCESTCPSIYTPDGGDTRQYTFPDLHIAPGMTSFDFEVSANNNAYVGLSKSNAKEDYMYEIGIGTSNNTGGIIRRCVYTWGRECGLRAGANSPTLMGLSGIPLYDHFRISFADGYIRLYRHGVDKNLMYLNDQDPLEINYVGFWTGFGSEGYWKFPSFC